MTGRASPKPRREAYLDGLRGLAALYVVGHHASLETGPLQAGSWVRVVGSALAFGRASVAVFIVLSGYCLSLSVARSDMFDVGGWGRFFRRRAWRILPPYYAAVLLSLACCLLVPGLDHPIGRHWDITLPVTTRAIVSHGLLVHNLWLGTAYKINHALWSVATECQIYVLFPILIVPCVRRLGAVGVTVGACAIGAACHSAFPGLDAARPWYVGLFCLGMLAAIVATRSDRAAGGTAVRRWGWPSATLAALTLVFAGAEAARQIVAPPWAIDYAVGSTTAALILHCRSAMRADGRSPLLALLECRPAAGLGLMSYSLYLIHPPILAAIGRWGRVAVPAGLAQLVWLLTVGTAASVAGGGLFFWAIERHFLPTPGPAQRPIVDALQASGS